MGDTASTILLIEDAPEVRAVARRILEREGYLVLEASTGEQALSLGRERGPGIDLLLTDLVLPDTTGPELVERLRPLCPNAKVLFVSGHSEDAATRAGVVEPGAAYLEKPFSVVALTSVVKELLAG